MGTRDAHAGRCVLDARTRLFQHVAHETRGVLAASVGELGALCVLTRASLRVLFLQFLQRRQRLKSANFFFLIALYRKIPHFGCP